MDPIQVAVRAFSRPLHERPADPTPSRALPDKLRHPPAILVLDTETTTDPSQRLLFASYRIIDAVWADGVPALSCVEEGLFHADDLSEWNPEGRDVLHRYVRTHAPAIDPDGRDPQPNLRLHTRAEFFREVWRPFAIDARAQVVCFNFPFDMSRLALHWGVAGPGKRTKEEVAAGAPRKRSAFEGGFSFEDHGAPLRHGAVNERSFASDPGGRERFLEKREVGA
jgi:hypothetical protein